jgi:hypothetical protein
VSGAVKVTVEPDWAVALLMQTVKMIKRVNAKGNNRPGETDMHGIVAQQESIGHSDSITVPFDV